MTDEHVISGDDGDMGLSIRSRAFQQGAPKSCMRGGLGLMGENGA